MRAVRLSLPRLLLVLSVSLMIAASAEAGRVHTRSSVMNDGNYSLVEYQDLTLGGPIERIDVYRCSQPSGGFGVTAAGTTVQALCGLDHLSPSSNRVFRNIFSRGPGPSVLPALLEIREEFNVAGMPTGSWEHRIRDVDANSPSYGRILRFTFAPVTGQPGCYDVAYEVRRPGPVSPTPISSPLTATVASLAPGLVDLGVSVAQLPPIDANLPANPLSFRADRLAGLQAVDSAFGQFSANFLTPSLSAWRNNFYTYLSFGDVGLKSSHPTTNLAGPAESVRLISELLVFRAYRADMGGGGRAFGLDLGQMTVTSGPLVPGVNDSKGNILHLWISGFINAISLHRLIVDKIHSDYGGIPMTLSPGSRLETGASPIVDATLANQTVAEIGDAFYLFPPMAAGAPGTDSQSVPAVSDVGLLILGGMIALIGVFVLARRLPA